MLRAMPPFPPCACMLWCLIKYKDNFSFDSYYGVLGSFPQLTGPIEVFDDNSTDYDTVQLRYRSETW
jgi:hypothetical protein